MTTETAPSIAAPTQDSVQQRAPVGELKSTGSTDVVSPQTESDVDNVTSAVKNVGRNTEDVDANTQSYKPAEAPSFADTLRKLQPAEMFLLLAIGLSIVAFLAAIVSGIAARRREPIISDYSD